MMARSRYISPAFFEDTKISELAISTRLLYIALWQIMDKGGICPFDVKLIKGHAFRYDDKISLKNVSEMLEELIQSGRLKKISFEGEEFLYCASLSEHQHFHRDEKHKYSIPEDVLLAPLKHGASTVQAPNDASASTPNRGELIEENGERITQNPTDVGARAHWLANLWNQNCGELPKCREVTASRRRAISAKLRDNPNPDYWQEVIRKLAASDFCNARTGKSWRATFDWLLKNDNHLKALEGMYDNKQAGVPGQAIDWEEFRRKNAV
jgi:hypothetical protein